MKVDIWSDIRCPFCYIGKRKFESGLAQFANKENIVVEWHSFELDPTLETRTDVSIYDYLATRKNISRQQAIQMNDYVTNVAKEVGLDFNMKDSVLANSFNAHRLIQLAKTKGLDDEAEEKLFKAHFTQAKNIDDIKTLINIGVSIGLVENEIRAMLNGNDYTNDVRKDQLQANEIGINGVPFFIINNKYAVSGAQAPATFLNVLEKAWTEYEIENPLEVSDTNSCSIDGC